jgi:hypothetical protein
MKKFAAIAFLTISFMEKALPQTIVQLSFVSPLISTFDMDYINDHVIISQQKLLIYDVSDPENPDKVGTATYPGNYAYKVAAQQNHVYMAMGNNGIFAVYNTDDFSNPTLTGSVAIPATSFTTAGDIAPYGDVVYLAGFDSLYVIDVSDPSSPVVAGKQLLNDVGAAGAGEMKIISTHLFITTGVATKVFDVSDPLQPVFVNSFANSHSSQTGIAADEINERIFLPWVGILGTYAGFDAIDVSDPLAPVFLFSDSTTFGSGDYGKSAYDDNVLFISTGGGINAYDVSPSDHDFVTSFTGEDVPNSTVALDVKDSILINARGGGFEVLLYDDGFATAVETPAENHSMFIFPNPISAEAGLINFNIAENVADAILSVKNSVGDEMLVKGAGDLQPGTYELKADELKPGFYFFTLSDETHFFTRSFIAQ